jgi:cysteine desulfurase/selenocysteine lyase
MDINALRAQFPMLNEKTMQGHPLIYFDNAATTFKPRRVIEAMNEYYFKHTSNTGRGDYDLAPIYDVKFEDSHDNRPFD